MMHHFDASLEYGFPSFPSTNHIHIKVASALQARERNPVLERMPGVVVWRLHASVLVRCVDSSFMHVHPE